VRGLSKTYITGSGEVTALKGLDFEIYDGEFVSVIGQSGCGKSTLLKVLAGLLHAMPHRSSVDMSSGRRPRANPRQGPRRWTVR
jgi:ABC-type lipoprotein export system ATPase subunit